MQSNNNRCLKFLAVIILLFEIIFFTILIWFLLYYYEIPTVKNPLIPTIQT